MTCRTVLGVLLVSSQVAFYVAKSCDHSVAIARLLSCVNCPHKLNGLHKYADTNAQEQETPCGEVRGRHHY